MSSQPQESLQFTRDLFANYGDFVRTAQRKVPHVTWNGENNKELSRLWKAKWASREAAEEGIVNAFPTSAFQSRAKELVPYVTWSPDDTKALAALWKTTWASKDAAEQGIVARFPGCPPFQPTIMGGLLQMPRRPYPVALQGGRRKPAKGGAFTGLEVGCSRCEVADSGSCAGK